jgi:putative transposase
MSKKAAGKSGKQEGNAPASLAAMVQQLVLPIVVSVQAAKQGLLEFVHQVGLLALQELFAAEAEAIAGPKGKHNAERLFHHWGTTQTVLPFGGRNVVVQRPRIRRKGGKGQAEVLLPAAEEFKKSDPIPERVAEQIVLGVSTRGYARSLEPLPEDVEARGASKSAASRALVEKTAEKLSEFLDRKLDDVELVAMFLDGIEVAQKSVIVALGVTKDGTKMPLGLWVGSTENAVIATGLLQNLIERGLRVDEPTLFVVDGGKGIRKALRDVFGDRAVVQRCQVHKTRNVLDYLPEARRPHVKRQMRDAYKSKSAKVAKNKLGQLASWLERNGEDSAAASLREGLDETLTVLRLGLSQLLCRTFSTTNAIENMNGTLRRVCRNVKRWRDETMIRRWVALGVGEAQRKFRRVKGHQQMPALVAALRPTTANVDIERNVA